MKATEESVRLLRWYDACRRDLPWRRTRDPYAVWISEVMLQQTQAETASSYFERFLTRFPTLTALAAADLQEVLALWSGLGYYRRARQLHSAARRMLQEGTGLPRTVAELRRLPGVGPYTAAAVASIAFGISVPAVDGNVVRVVARRGALDADPGRAPARRAIAAAAAKLLHPGRPGDSNQAIMELGATVCMPRNPDCARCPLRQGCRAAAAGHATRYPRPRARRPRVRRQRRVVVVRARGRVLLFRRPLGASVLAGTWELPWTERCEEAALEAALAGRYGGRWTVGPPRVRLRHSVTYRSFEIEVREGKLLAGAVAADSPEAGWFGREELDELPLSSLVRKVLAAVPEERGPGQGVSSEPSCPRPADASRGASRRFPGDAGRPASRGS